MLKYTTDAMPRPPVEFDQFSNFENQTELTLRVFCPNPKTVIATFEDYLPAYKDVDRISANMRPDFPARVSVCKSGYDYYAYLPKDRNFEGHLWEPIKHEPEYIQRDGRWFMDTGMREVWRAIDNNISRSINVIGSYLWLTLDHHTPDEAHKYGFTRGHKSKEDLKISIKVSKHALLHRFAYLMYTISIRYNWEAWYLQPWRDQIAARCGSTWLDSVWDTICRQWASRNFIGVILKPTETSVKWVQPALRFGVPIWVSFPTQDCYKKLDGGKVMDRWTPTELQVKESRWAEMERLKILHAQSTTMPSPSEPPVDPSPEPPAAPHPEPPTDPPQPHSKTISPPAELPPNSKWYESWEAFFRKRDEANSNRLKTASDKDKQSWEARAINAKTFSPPGKTGPRVYVWESCDSGGFLRILQDRFDAGQGWDGYYREALVYSAPDNVWDHCPFLWKPAVESGCPDDSDDEDQLLECWYVEPGRPANLPNINVPSLEFLWQRYGFISIEPTTIPKVILPLDNSTIQRIVGLQADSQPVQHLPIFVNCALQGKLPIDNCDLSPTSPPNERFTDAWIVLIRHGVFRSLFPELSERVVFTLTYHGEPRLLVVHEPLSLLQMVRMGVGSQLTDQLLHLIAHGCRFTLLYPQIQPLNPVQFNILLFPIRPEGWNPDLDDYSAYTSRIKTFLVERPYLVVAALSRGGIAWRLTVEVLGIEGSVERVVNTHPVQDDLVNTSQGVYRFHDVDEGEWFYLVGGYEVLTGL